MKNKSGLTRFMSIYNGMIHFGFKEHRIHDEYSEKTFIIECSSNIPREKLILTELEAKTLATEILKAFK